jgi:apolipoprotein N-acyltransferase
MAIRSLYMVRLKTLRLGDVLLSLCGGALLGIGFIVTPLWWTSLIGFAPILFALSRDEYRLRDVFALGFLAGFAAYGLSFYEVFWSTLPLSWLGIKEAWFAIFAVFLIWFLTVAGFALTTGLFAMFIRWSGARSWTALVVIPSAWVIADWLGMWIFAIHTLGPDSLLGANFSMGSFGYLLADNAPLLQIATLGGIFALNFAVAFFGVLFFLTASAKNTRERAAYIFLVLVVATALGCTQLYLSRQSSSSERGRALSVAAVSTQTPDVLDPSQEQVRSWFQSEAVSVAAIRGADLIILPEGSGFLEYLYRDPMSSARQAFARAGNSTPPTVVDSVSLREPDGNLYSRTEYFDAASGASTFSYKYYLMPFGEQLPYFYRAVAYVMGKWNDVESILGARRFSLKGEARPVLVRGVPISALLCSEAMAPTLYRNEVLDGAQVLVNLSSHAWFHGSYPLYIELRRVDAVRAAESRRWMVEAGNIAPSFILDPYGRLVAEGGWGSKDTVTATVYARTGLTPFDVLGEGIVLLFAVGALFPVVWLRMIATRGSND